MNRLERIGVDLLKLPVRFYRFAVSPLLGQSCRFHPTCSAYALEALERHGVIRGLCLIVCRVMRCHPWHTAHWHDPVPKRFTWGDIFGYKRRQNTYMRDHCEFRKGDRPDVQ